MPLLRLFLQLFAYASIVFVMLELENSFLFMRARNSSSVQAHNEIDALRFPSAWMSADLLEKHSAQAQKRLLEAMIEEPDLEANLSSELKNMSSKLKFMASEREVNADMGDALKSMSEELKTMSSKLENMSREHLQKQVNASGEDAKQNDAHDEKSTGTERRNTSEIGNDTDKDLEKLLHVWTWPTWTCFSILALGCLASQLFCLYTICIDEYGGGICADAEYGAVPADEPEEVQPGSVGDEQSRYIRWLIRREMRISLLYPLLPIAAEPWTTCEEGAPYWIYIAFLPLLLRAKWQEFRILRMIGRAKLKVFLSFAFVFGTADIADWFFDGGFPVQAYACDDQITEPFAVAIAQSKIWPLAPVVMSMRFWGISYLLLIVAALSQHAVATQGVDTEQMAVGADIAGFGAVGDFFEQNYSDPVAKGYSVASRVLMENCLQMNFQATFFAIIFDQLNLTGKLKVLVSLALGAFGALYKVASLARKVFDDSGLDCKEDHFVFNVPGMVFPVLFVAWTAAKVYFAFTCEHHLWNLSTLSCAELGSWSPD